MHRYILSSLAALLMITGASQAQLNYPTRPVRIVVPTAPGGAADTIARMLAQHLSKTLGQQFFVENRPGAGNIIGIETVAHSPGDGYTLLLGAATITLNHVVHKKLPYDVERDFTPITQMVSVPNVLVVHPSQPIHTLAEFITTAKQKPGQLNYASAGVGSNLHLAMELLKHMAGIDVVHVPYKGVGPAIQDVLAGHVASMVSNILSARSHVTAGQLRALAVTSLKRSSAMPDVPTVSEAGLPGYEVLNWFGLFAPAGTPEPIITRIYAGAAELLASPEFKQRLASEGADPVGSKPADFAVFVKAELQKWDEVAKAANIQKTE